VHIIDAPCAVDQEDLSEKLVFAEFVSGNLPRKASCRVLPNQVGNSTDLNKKTDISGF
jgi:hypothetical protein